MLIYNPSTQVAQALVWEEIRKKKTRKRTDIQFWPWSRDEYHTCSAAINNYNTAQNPPSNRSQEFHNRCSGCGSCKKASTNSELSRRSSYFPNCDTGKWNSSKVQQPCWTDEPDWRLCWVFLAGTGGELGSIFIFLLVVRKPAVWVKNIFPPLCDLQSICLS